MILEKIFLSLYILLKLYFVIGFFYLLLLDLKEEQNESYIIIIWQQRKWDNFAINQMHHDYHSEHVICVCMSFSLSFFLFLFQKLKKRDVSKKFFFLLYNICDLFSEIVSIETNLYNKWYINKCFREIYFCWGAIDDDYDDLQPLQRLCHCSKSILRKKLFRE